MRIAVNFVIVCYLGFVFSDEIQKEIQSVKKEYHKNKLKKEEEKPDEVAKLDTKNENIEEYKIEYDKYKSKKDSLPKKGAGREQFTLQLLEKFKKKLQTIKDGEDDTEKAVDDEEQAW